MTDLFFLWPNHSVAVCMKWYWQIIPWPFKKPLNSCYALTSSISLERNEFMAANLSSCQNSCIFMECEFVHLSLETTLTCFISIIGVISACKYSKEFG